MNERIRELMLEVGFVGYGEDLGSYNIPVPAFNSRMEKFAELIVRECVELFDGNEQSELGYRIGDRIYKHFGVK